MTQIDYALMENGLTVTKPNIAYVVLHDQGGGWMVDNIASEHLHAQPTFAIIIS